MSDEPRRLLETADPRVALTLRSALRDEPSNESIARAAHALGIGAAAMSTVTAATTAARAAAHAGQGVSVGAAVGKWLAIGVLVGGAAGSTWVLQSTPAPAPARHAGSGLVIAQSPPTGVAATHQVNQPASSVPPPTSVAPTSVAPTANVVRSRTAARESSGPVASGLANADQGALAADLDLLSRARDALKSDNANVALAILSRRERELPVRALDAEAMLIRVQALVAAGRSAEARAVARAALSGHSESAYACRLASIASVDAPSCSGKR